MAFPAFDPSKHPRGAKGSGQGGRFISSTSNPQQDKAAKGAQQRLGGKLTTERIRSFQQRNGLTVDGIIGRQTAEALLGNPDAKNIPVGELTKALRNALSQIPGGSRIAEAATHTLEERRGGGTHKTSSGKGHTARARHSSSSSRARASRKKKPEGKEWWQEPEQKQHASPPNKAQVLIGMRKAEKAQYLADVKKLRAANTPQTRNMARLLFRFANGQHLSASDGRKVALYLKSRGKM